MKDVQLCAGVLGWGAVLGSWGMFLRCAKAAIAQRFSQSDAHVEVVGPNVGLSS